MPLGLSSRLSASQIATGTIAVSVLVLALKLAAWALTGSVALFSDAMESLVNVSAAVLAWFESAMQSARPMMGTRSGTTRPSISLQ